MDHPETATILLESSIVEVYIDWAFILLGVTLLMDNWLLQMARVIVSNLMQGYSKAGFQLVSIECFHGARSFTFAFGLGLVDFGVWTGGRVEGDTALLVPLLLSLELVQLLRDIGWYLVVLL